MSVDDQKTGAPAPSGGLARRATASVAWTVSQQWVIRGTGFITVAILARVLAPADFGVVAAALSLLTFVQLLADMGFATYLVQAERPTDRTFSTAFWYTIFAGALLTLALVALAPLLALALNTPEVGPVIQGIAPAALLVTLGSVPIAVLRRELKFRLLALQSVVAGMVGQVVAIVLALTGFGVWALVAQLLVFQLIATTMAWISSGWRPRLAFSWSEFVTMTRFGIKVVATDVVGVLRIFLENVIIVAALGVTGLGYLSIAQRLISIAHDLTTNSVATVSLAVFTKIRDATARLLSAYLRAQNMTHALVTPVMLVIAVGAPLLLPLLFGDQWGPSVVPCQILAAAGVLTMSGMDRGLFLGQGKPGRWLAYVAAVDAVTIVMALVIAPFGLVAYASGFLAIAAIATIVRWVMVGRQLDARWLTIASPLLRTSVPALTAAAAGFVVSALTVAIPDWVQLILVGLSIMIVYVPLVRLMLPSAWNELVGFAFSFRKRQPVAAEEGS